jgi:diaminohydroxyphosphoribosylaminopyrimidine deaminase/5-amino-6-(5-phosphoribosylamino)uracil reductase
MRKQDWMMVDTDRAIDEHFMRMALVLGRRGLGRVWPNPAVGAVIVNDVGGVRVVVGRGWTQPGGRPHAETEALLRAGEGARGGTLYVTLEPCSHHGKTPPCVDAIVAAGITRVVSAIVDPNPLVAGAGHWCLAEQGITVEVGIGAEAARRAHAGHIRRTLDHRPHVILKLAVSADGKVGLAGPRPAAITGEAARERIQFIRATSDAVLTGIGTVLADDPLLTCRLPGMQDRSPVRVVLDGALRIPPESKLIATARQTPLWVITSEEAPTTPEEVLLQAGALVLRASSINGRLGLVPLLGLLAERGITRLMVEAGPVVATAFARADLVDEAIIFRSSNAIGADGLDALEGIPLDRLTDALDCVNSEKLGPDVVMTYERKT